MRLFPIIAAIAVVILIYFFVFQREQLLGGPDTETAAVQAPVEEDATSTEPGADLVKVIAIKSTARQLDQAVLVRGQTEADREVQLRSETSGQVISAPLRKGAFVEEGQLICKLAPGTREAQLAEAEAGLTEAQARLPEAEARGPEAEARLQATNAQLMEAQSRLTEAQINDNAAQKLSDNGFASTTRVAATEAAVRGAEAAITLAEAAKKAAESGLETVEAGIKAARAGIHSAEAELEAARHEIDRLDITAPFSGLLESDSAELGSLLQPGGLCATIIQLDPVILVGFVPETQVGQVTMGADATGILASGAEASGKVVFISRSADPTTRTFRVEIEAPNPDLAIRDGQTAEIAIRSDGTPAHLLPQSVLTLDDAGTMGVRAVDDDNTVVFYPVTLLRDAPNGVWLAGLPDQVDVIAVGQEYVSAGVQVAPSYQEVGQ